MVGRTFQQHASPITFGLKVAVWLDEVLRHIERFEQLKPRVLVGQCGGAVGTLSSLGEDGLAVRRALMDELGLGEADVTWHTARDRWSEMVSWLAMLATTLGKIAVEVAALMRTEVGEAAEAYLAGRGGSSAVPQKRNSTAAPRIIAIPHRMRELPASQLSAMIQEHERGVGAMPLEWMVIPDAFILTSESLDRSIETLAHLEVDAARMRANLDLDGGLLMAESVMMGLAPTLGRKRAMAILRRLHWATWRCRWCGDDLPDHVRADALYCREACRKKAARERRAARGAGCCDL
jgi:3-carboxy-cis,cis-muconate cycloisomerase